MEPEDRLDALLAASARRWRATADASSDAALPDEALTPLLAAADRLGDLRHAAPAPDFARTLGEQLRARTEHLRDVQALAAERRAAERLAAERSQQGQRSQGRAPERRDRRMPGALPIAARAARRPTTLIPLPTWALRTALAAAAVFVLAFGVTVYAAIAQVGPDNPLYVVSRAVQNVQEQVASSQADRTQLSLNHAGEALQQLDAAAQRHDNGGYATALKTLNDELAAANQALASVSAGSDHDALAGQLSDLQAQVRHDLAADLANVNWDNRLSTTNTLGALGVGVPHVTAATVVQQGDEHDGGQPGGQPGSGQHGDQVTVTGSGFAPGAVLVIDGHAARVVTITVGPSQLIAVVADEGAEQAHSIGISNPDGTAAQTTHITVHKPSDGGDNGDGGHPGATPTPSPTGTPGDHGGTPTPGDGH
jgi:hypothetical protein